MKLKIFTSILFSVIMSIGFTHAQLLLEENFDYDASRALILDPIASSDNYDGVTGWSTQSNSTANVNCFNITSAPLTYGGYVGSAIGNAVKYNGDAGQGVFKLFSKNVRNDSTVYIAFIVSFPNDVKVTGGDYFLGIKMEPQATSTNWGGRIFAAVDPAFPGEEVSFGINKASGGTTTWVNASTGPFFPANQPLLVVMKYKVGILNGANATEEAGNYDDQMTLFVNPVLNGTEPTTNALYNADATQKDLYRYTSTGSVFGGARGLYLRASALGNAPAYTMDGIRVGETWQEATSLHDGLRSAVLNKFYYSVDDAKQINIIGNTENYSGYELVSISGQRILSGKLDGNKIDASSLKSGVYLLNLNGVQQASAKFFIH